MGEGVGALNHVNLFFDHVLLFHASPKFAHMFAWLLPTYVRRTYLTLVFFPCKIVFGNIKEKKNIASYFGQVGLDFLDR